jgi:hypothetical protein
MGKGSKQRPREIDTKTFADNWDAIFSKKNETEKSAQQGDTELKESKDGRRN